MNKLQMRYFEQEDILHITIAEGPEASSMDITPDVTAELDAAGSLIGIEILNASDFIRDAVVENVQGRLLGLSKASH